MSDAPQKPKWVKGGPSPNPGGRKKAPQPGVAQPVSTTEKRDTRFKAGNPGRPKGALNKSTMAALAIMEAGRRDHFTQGRGTSARRRFDRDQDRARPASRPQARPAR